MWKWTRLAAYSLAIALLASFLSVWTTGYIVNSYMEAVLKQLDLPLQTQPFALSGVWGRLWGADPAPEAQAGPSDPEPSPSASDVPSSAAAGGESPTPDTEGGQAYDGGAAPGNDGAAVPGDDGTVAPGDGGEDQSANASPPPSDEESTPVFGNNAGSSGMSEQQQQAYDSAMSKLNAGQLQQMTEYLQDGLTQEEWTKIGELIKPTLSDDEYQAMMNMLQSRIEPSVLPNDEDAAGV